MQLDGIYGGVESIPPNINHVGTELGGIRVFLAFFADGRVYWGAPPEGLDGQLPPTNGRTKDDWGRYAIANNVVQINLPNEQTIVGKVDGDRLQFERSRISTRRMSLILWPRVSSRALNGVYQFAAGTPAISFVNATRFEDEGFQTVLGTIANFNGDIIDESTPNERLRRRGGAGMYTLRNYTLTLRYDDGRVARLPLFISAQAASTLPVTSFRVFAHEFEHR